MSSLLAILLVVNSTRGHHYLFSYPPNPKRASNRTQHHERTNDFTVGSSMASRNLTPDNDENRRPSNASKSNDTNQDIFAGRDTIFNLDVSFLADTLAPKLPLCDGKFQLSMDDLTFVGHPVSLSTLQHDDNDQNDLHEQQQQSETGSPNTSSQFTSPPSPPISQPPLTSSSNDRMDTNTADDNESVSDISPGSTSIHMTLFHVVFVMTPPDLELNAQVETIYKNVILRYSSALRYEQLRCGYVQEEIEKVLGLKEEAFNKGNNHPPNTIMG